MDFCVKCGKKDVYKKNLCKKCYEEEYPSNLKKKVKEIKKVKVTICKRCRRYLWKNKWLPYDDLRSIVIKKIKEKLNIKKARFYFDIN